MVLEIATLTIRSGTHSAFEAAFVQASRVICEAQGYVSHELQRSVDGTDRYVLFVYWRTREDHTVGFRESVLYQQWRALLHHFFAATPEVEHFERIYPHVAPVA